MIPGLGTPKREYDTCKTVEEYQQFLKSNRGQKLERKERRTIQARISRMRRTARFEEFRVEKERLKQEIELAKAENKSLRDLIRGGTQTATLVAGSPGHSCTSCIDTLLTNSEATMKAFLQKAGVFRFSHLRMVSDCATTIRRPARKKFCQYLTVHQGDWETIQLNLALGFVDILSQVSVGMTDRAFTAFEDEIEKFGLKESDQNTVLKLCSTGKCVYEKLTDGGDPNLAIGYLKSCGSFPVECLSNIGRIFAISFVQSYGLRSKV
ncbi:hypothetical protein AOL_s00091g24 [Orbilia oligospora ATCC 24927]|uniref:BZIP domain-containing protein n=1 Tax=Arthrobotrys oligospora (strain ATCC 24927 / CBS 115.81 / DSM 1491) TaxID=756982 RepID=G1XHX2_ARTOA|nr:hypothetical protein AOL_s00091g24 [Orbilia oligospora ATCC 24927]EGX47203.1 hypothetical protein AOL_s00091g24 [Orbilia oligospora ATCC 24927]